MTHPRTLSSRLTVAALALGLATLAGLGCEQDSRIGVPGSDAAGDTAGRTDVDASGADTADTGTDTQSPVDTGADTQPPADTRSDTLADAGPETGDTGDTSMDADTGPETYPSETVEQFHSSFQELAVDIRCREATDPACRDDREPPMPGVPARAICEARLSKVAVLGGAEGRYEMKKAVASGRQTFDKKAARACIEKMKQEVMDATACKQFWGEGTTVFSFNSRYDDNPCERVLRPAVGMGDKCLNRSDCKPGLWCDEEARADKCGGRCVELGGKGDACDFSSLECKSGLVCEDGTCQKNPPKSAGIRCDSDTECKDGLMCKAEAGDSRRCRPLLGPGQSCEFGECQSGHDCVTDPSQPNGSTKICVAEESKAAGQACTDDDICKPGLLCRNNTCQTVRRRGRGKACDGVLDFCRVGLACRPTSSGSGRRCADFGAVGEPCVDNACQAGLYCKTGNADTGTCEPVVGEGKSCEPGGCRGTLYCVAGSCIDRAPAGARCDQKLCEPGVRCTYHDNNNVCGGISGRCTL